LEADIEKILKDIYQETLIIAGEADLLANLKDAHRLADGIKGSKLVAIPKCGHIPHIEKPDLFCSLILNFLRGMHEW